MKNPKRLLQKLTATLSLLAFAGVAQAATITAWDTTDVDLNLGPYTLYESYVNFIYTDASFSTTIGGISWKESDSQAPGISIVNGDDQDGTNCVMTSGYNPYDFTIKQCSDPFQSSKRFKSLMNNLAQPTVIKFNVTNDGSVKTYSMMQKLSNWTGVDLTDFAIELGFVDANGNWIPSTVGDGLAITTSTGKPVVIGEARDKDMVALFAHGLFGAPDKHHPEPGYFDPNERGDFALQAAEDRFESNGISDNHYNLFGLWNSAPITIYGMYWDSDQLYYTDNILMANCQGTFDEVAGVCDGTWMTYRSQEGTYIDPVDGLEKAYISDGVAKPVSAELLAQWAADPWVAPGPIDDFANLSLNWYITLGNSANWPTPDSFAIRLIPRTE
ncbi:choice-of-anchor F family protein [Desulfuromonas sp. AOP6]|uniref:choice-of-anchor F family protein n=1 Tax=Desulfuromonas sp. AOP6 TaxID=1566351 RepID=UPI001286C3F0|nr:choice-of-anchor F family protein [Desulfuromonas sp. AOP6]BCA78883.1 hypothetical protein AOP6_0670 [Desulfuromonas sp. AOP6]